MKFNFADDILLENNRVRIEALKEDHLEKLYPISNENPSLLKFSPKQFGQREQFIDYINKALNERDKEISYPFAIYDKLMNEYAGSTRLANISITDQRVEIGWTWLGSQFQRSGLNRNCKFILLEFLFEKMDFKRVELKTDSRNIQSRKAIEAIGAKFEGELRSHTLMSDGFRRNTVYYSILNHEWDNIKKEIFKEIEK